MAKISRVSRVIRHKKWGRINIKQRYTIYNGVKTCHECYNSNPHFSPGGNFPFSVQEHRFRRRTSCHSPTSAYSLQTSRFSHFPTLFKVGKKSLSFRDKCSNSGDSGFPTPWPSSEALLNPHPKTHVTLVGCGSILVRYAKDCNQTHPNCNLFIKAIIPARFSNISWLITVLHLTFIHSCWC